MRSMISSIFFMSLGLFFLECQLDPTVGTDPEVNVARVGKTVLTIAELEAEMEATNLASITNKMRKDWVSDWIRTELLFLEALRQGLDNEQEIVREFNRMRRDHLANSLLERIQSDSLSDIGDDEVKDYYEEHQQNFIYHEPELKLSVIVLPDEASARQIRSELSRRRSSFGEIARTRSIHPSSIRGGDLGYLKRSDISDISVQKLVFSMYVGQVSRPVLSESGSYIFRVMDRREAGTMIPLEEVHGEIATRILIDRRREHIGQFVESLRKEANIELFSGNLVLPELRETNNIEKD